MTDNISISLSEGGHHREVSEVRVDGVIDTLTASELEQVIDSLLRRDRFRIVVDLAGVDYISSAGWGIFISHIKDVRDNGGDVKLAGMIPDVREIFELLEFDKILKAYPSVDDAVRDFGSSPDNPGGSKEKKSPVTRVDLIENLGSGRAPGNRGVSESSRELVSGGGDLDLFALRMIKNDPFVTISEIAEEYGENSNNGGAGWWQVMTVLWRHRLLRRRSRFRYAWSRA